MYLSVYCVLVINGITVSELYVAKFPGPQCFWEYFILSHCLLISDFSLYWLYTIIRQIFQGIWLHTQREDGTNTLNLRTPQRNSHSCNDTILIYECKSLHTGLRHILFRHCNSCATRRHISLDYELRTSIDLIKENGFKLAKERCRSYPAQAITNADYADDIALLANTTAQAEFHLHNLERAAGGIGLHVNVDKTEYMCFNQRVDTSTLKGGSLKLVDKFTYLGSSVSSTENDINTRVTKAWTAIYSAVV